MWATRLLRSVGNLPSLYTAPRNFFSTLKPSINDCTFMQLRSYNLTPNIFLHNIRELLEKMSISEQGLSLAEMMELSLLNQSTTLSSIILSQNDFDLELAINLDILMDKRVISTQ